MSNAAYSEKHEQANRALSHLFFIMKDLKPKDDITLKYAMLDESSLKEFSAWDIERFHLLPRDEYVFIRKREEYDGQYHLLYVINVGALSVLAIAAETMDLLSRKF